MSQLGFEPIFDSFPVAVCLTLALLLLLGIKPQFGALSIRRQRVLLALRFIIVLLAAFTLLRPTWITTVRTPRRGVLLVLLDASRSMLLKSGRASETRWDAQKNALHGSADELAKLARTTEIRAYAYDANLKPLAAEAGRIPVPAAPEGQQTDIGSTLDSALKAEQGKRVVGVVLLGDGTQTAFEPLVETQQAARKIRDDFSAPLYTITFGLSGDAEQTRDVAIERLDEQFTVFVKNELVVRGQVRVRGFVNQDLIVKLFLTDDQKKTELIGETKIKAEVDNQQIEVEFPAYVPQVPGRFRLTMHAEEQDGEQVIKNNKLDAYLTVLEGGLRVLYVDGENLGEQKFLRRAIDASPDIELEYHPVDRRSRGKSPIDLGADLTSDKFDAFILGDVDSLALGKANLEALAAAVGKGKGLLMLGGLSSFGRGRYGGSPLAPVLPIEIDSLEEAEFNATELDRFFLPGPIPMMPTATHSITRLASGAENFDLWRRLPPLVWAHKFSGLKQSPGVRVLLESPQQDPLLISGEFGAGRTLAFAGQSTYLWPLHGFATEHNRFWRQLILWLVKKDELNRDDIWIKLDQRRFNPGSRVNFEAGARSGTGDPIADARLETTIAGPDGRQQPVTMAKDAGQFRGSWQALSPGDYTIETVAFQGDKQLGTAKAEFVVFDRDVELSTPAADPDLMASLSAWTKKEGGRPVAPEELPGLLSELAARPPEYEVRQTRWKLGSTAGDAWGLLLAMTGVLSLEWFLRKRWGLV